MRVLPGCPCTFSKEFRWDKSRNQWKAVIGYNYRKIQIGRYVTELEAAAAYNKKARQLHGKYAVLNNVQ